MSDWLVCVALATACWAISDICSDSSIQPDQEPAKTKELKGDSDLSDAPHASDDGIRIEMIPKVIEKGLSDYTCMLKGEQGALVSVVVSVMYAVFLHTCLLHTQPFTLADVPLALVGGGLHMCAYLLLLKAYEHASSTEITPLLQLSALWLLPLSLLDAKINGEAGVRGVHLVAFTFILLGGLLPVTAGKLTALKSVKFWKNSAVGLCVISEFLVALYTLLLHQNTFTTTSITTSSPSSSQTTIITITPPPHDHTAAHTASELWHGGDGHQFGFFGQDAVQRVLRYFVMTRYGSGVAVILILCFSNHLRRNFYDLTNPQPAMRGGRWKCVAVKAAGDFLSVSGLLVNSLAYARFYEPSLINGAEGGLQQLLNLTLAFVLYRICGLGRPVKNLGLKIFSFVIVSCGLVMSTY